MPVHEGLTYDPRFGFHIHYPTNVFNGMFRCDATLGNITDSLRATLVFKGRYLSVYKYKPLFI